MQKNIKSIIVFLPLMLWITITYAKTNKDSLLAKRYLDESKGLINVNPDSALIVIEKGLTIARNEDFEKLELYLLNNKAVCNMFAGRYADCVVQFLTLKKLADKLNEPEVGSAAVTNISKIYSDLFDTEKALEYLEIAVKEYPKADLGLVYINVCAMKIRQKKYDEAANILTKIDLKNTQDPTVKEYYNYNKLLLDIYDHKPDVIKTIDSLTRLLPTADAYNQSIVYAVLGDYQNMYKKDYDGAEKSYLLAYKLAQGLGYDSYTFEIYTSLLSFYNEQKNYKKANEVQAKIDAIRAKISSPTKIREINARVEEFYQQERRDELEKLKIENEKNALELKSKTIIQYSIFGFVAMLMILGFVIFRNYRNKQKIKELAEREKLRLQIAADLHDEVGSSISSIRINSSLAGAMPNANNKWESISHSAEEIQKSMQEIVWSLKPENDTAIKLAEKMRSFANELLESKNITLQFVTELNNPEQELPVLLKRNLFLIFKEAVNNCAKYAEATEVHISLQVSAKNINLDIKDNGIGYEPSSVAHTEGNGLHNMRQRAEQLGATFNITTDIGKGVSLSFSAKIT